MDEKNMIKICYIKMNQMKTKQIDIPAIFYLFTYVQFRWAMQMPRDGGDALEIKGRFDLQGLEETVIKLNGGLCRARHEHMATSQKLSEDKHRPAPRSCLTQQESGDEGIKSTRSPEEETTDPEYEAAFH